MDGGDFTPSGPPKPLSFDPAARKRIIAKRIELEQNGFVYANANDTMAMCKGIDLTAILAYAQTAPPDRYDPSGGRRRYFSSGIYQPWSGRLNFSDPHVDRNGDQFVPYLQSAAINSEFGDQERHFAPLPTEVQSSQTLHNLVRMVFELLPGDLFDRRRLQAVGVHLIRLWSDGRRRAIPSPPHLHTDGEPLTAIVFLGRENCAPGSAVNYIAERYCRGQQPQDCFAEDMLATITMREPGEMIIVDDRRVSHHVSGVHGANGKPGSRASLLVDFSELLPDRTN